MVPDAPGDTISLAAPARAAASTVEASVMNDGYLPYEPEAERGGDGGKRIGDV